MKLRRPIDPASAVAATCPKCGHPVATLLRTEVDAEFGVVRVEGRCPDGHLFAEERPIPRRPGGATPPAPA